MSSCDVGTRCRRGPAGLLLSVTWIGTALASASQLGAQTGRPAQAAASISLAGSSSLSRASDADLDRLFGPAASAHRFTLRVESPPFTPFSIAANGVRRGAADSPATAITSSAAVVGSGSQPSASFSLLWLGLGALAVIATMRWAAYRRFSHGPDWFRRTLLPLKRFGEDGAALLHDELAPIFGLLWRRTTDGARIVAAWSGRMGRRIATSTVRFLRVSPAEHRRGLSRTWQRLWTTSWPQRRRWAGRSLHFVATWTAIVIAAIPGTIPTRAFAVDGSWNIIANGMWSDATKWNGGVPDGVGAVANLTFNINPPVTVTLDSSRTIGILNIGDVNSNAGYTLNAINDATLTFDNGDFVAQINQTSGSHSNTISAPILLNSSLDITNFHTTDLLTISGSISAGTTGLKIITNKGANGADVTLSGLISDGNGTIKVVQNATNSDLTLSGANTFSGGVDLLVGTLNLNNASALGTGSFLINGGVLNNSSAAAITLSTNNAVTINGDFTFTGTQDLNLGGGNIGLGSAAGTTRSITVNAKTLTLGGMIADGTTAQGLVKLGAGALTLAGDNTFSGGVQLTAGTLNLNHAAALGSGALTIGGGTTLNNNSTGAVALTTNNAVTVDGDFTFTGTQELHLGNGNFNLGTAAGTTRSITVAAKTLTLGGAIADGSTAQGLIKLGAGTLALAGGSSFSGGVTLSAGILRVDGAEGTGVGPLGTGGTITFGGGTLQFSAGNQFDYSSRFSTAAQSMNIDTNGQDVLFASSLMGDTAGSLIKLGAGTLTLGGVNTYSGGTTVSAGILAFSNDNQLGATTAGITIATGATLQAVGSTTINTGRTLTFAAGSFLGAAGASTTLNIAAALGPFAGSITKVGIGTVRLTGIVTNSSGKDIIVNAGKLQIDDDVTNGSATGGLLIGLANASSAAVLQTGGVFTTGTTDGGNVGLTLGSGTNAFGAYTITDGTMNIFSRIDNGLGANSVGMINVLGGAVNVSGGGYLINGRTPTSTGVLHIDGGTVSTALTVASHTGSYGGGRFETNIRNGSLEFGTTGFNLTSSGGGTTVVNLLAGGTLRTNFLTSGAPSTGNFGQINFHGGTLQYSGSAAQTGFTAQPTRYSTYVHSLGGTIDDNGQSITMSSALLAPPGSGVSSIALVDGGSGYLAAPYVKITGGGGTGATAIATIDAAGKITGIIITNPGVNYTEAPTVTLVGGLNGSATIPAAVGTVNIAANSSGGITKTGLGTLILSSAGNNYSGVTQVNSGTLRAGIANAFSPNSTVSLGATGTSATLDLAGFSATVGGLQVGSGATAAGQIIGNSSTTAAATLTVNTSAGNSNFTGVIQNTVDAGTQTLGLSVSGTGVFTLSNANTYTGTTSILSGTLRLNAAQAVSASSPIVLSATGANAVAILDFNGFPQTFNAVSLGGTTTTSTPIVNLNGATLTLGGNVTYSATANPLGGQINGGTIDLNGAPRTFTVGNSTSAGVDLAVTSVIQGDGGLSITGGGTMELSNVTSTYTGATQLLAGVLRVASLGSAGSPSSLGNTAAAVQLADGTVLQYVGSGQTSNRNLDFTGAAGAALDASGSGALVWTGTLSSSGAGAKILTLQGSSTAANTLQTALTNLGGNVLTLSKSGTGSWTLNQNNSYTGGTSVSAGVLNLTGGGTLGAVSNVLTLSGGQLNLGGTHQTVGAATISAAADGVDTLLNGTLTAASYSLTNTTGNVTISAVLAGASAQLSKSGAGTATLSVANSYAGGTSISGGVLALSGLGTLGSTAGTLTLAGGQLNLGGTVQNVGAVNFTASAAAEAITNGMLFGTSYTSAHTTGTAVVSAVLGGTGVNLAVNAAGILRLTGDNTFTGAISVNAGTLQFSKTSSLGLGTGAITLGSTVAGALTFVGNANQTVSRNVTLAIASYLGAAGTDDAVVTYTGTINSGANNLVLIGNGTSGGHITGPITGAGTGADFYVQSGNWTFSGTPKQVPDLFLVETGGNLNLNSTGVLSFNAGNGLYIRSGGSTVTLNADDVNNGGAAMGLLVIGDEGVGTLNTKTYKITTATIDLGQTTAGYAGHIIGTGTVTVTSTASDAITLYSGSIAANLAGPAPISKISSGTVTLSGNNSGLTTTTNTTLRLGELVLDFTANNSGPKLSTTAALNMQGGRLTMIGNADGDSLQTINGLLASVGPMQIAVTNASGRAAVLNLNAITRSAGGFVDFSMSSADAIIQTTSTNDDGGLLGAWATVDGSYYATVVNGAVVAHAAQAKDGLAAWSAGNNVTDLNGFEDSVGSLSIHSLRFAAAGATSTVAIDAGSTLNIASGGILVTGAVGSGAAAIQGGTLSGNKATGELTVTQNNTASAFTLGARLSGNTALAKVGLGELLLVNAGNDYFGTTTIYEGVLSVSGGNAIGDNSPVAFVVDRAATLRLNADETISATSGGHALSTIDLTDRKLTYDVGASHTYAGLLVSTAAASFIKTGPADLTLSGVSTGFNGTIAVNAETLLVSGTLLNVAGYVLTGPTASLQVVQNGDSDVNRLSDTAGIILNATAGGNGLWITNNNDQSEIRKENIGAVTLGAGHNVITAQPIHAAATTRAQFAASALLRTNKATLLVRGENLSQSSIRSGFVTVGTTPLGTVGGAGGAGTTTISILPYVIGDAGSGSQGLGNSFIYDSAGTTGLRPLNIGTEYLQNAAAYNALTGATQHNVRFFANPAAALTGSVSQINSLVLDSSATPLTITGPNSTLNIRSGGILVATTAAANAVTLGGYAGLTVDAGQDYNIFVTAIDHQFTLASPLTSSAASLVKSGIGTLVLAGGANSVADVYFNQGAVQFSNLNQLGGGPLRFFGGALKWASGNAIDVSGRSILIGAGGATFDTNGNDVVLANAFGTGSGGFTKTGAGNLTLNAPLGNTGATTVSGGTLTLGTATAIAASSEVNIAGGTLDIGGFDLTLAKLTLSGGVINGTGTIFSPLWSLRSGAVNAVLTGSQNLYKSGDETFVLGNTANTYTGQTHIMAGTLGVARLGNDGDAVSSIGNTSAPLQMAGGATLQYVGGGETSARTLELLGAGGAILDASGTGAWVWNGNFIRAVAGTKTFTLQGTSTAANTLASPLADFDGAVVSLVKTGSGAWTLSGANTYTGMTSINAGTLTISGSIIGNVNVNGGTLNVSGSINGATPTTTLSYGTTAGNSIVNVTGNLNLFATAGAGIAGSVAVYNQTDGNAVITSGASTTASYVTNTSNAYGYFNLTGGLYQQAGRFNVNASTALTGTGVAYIGGTGSLHQNGGDWMMIAYAGLAQLTVGPGGTLTRTGVTSPLAVMMNVAGGYGVLNLAGGTLDAGTQPIRFGNGNISNTTGFVNLAGGTLRMGVNNTVSLSTGSNNVGYYNFAGATIQATATLSAAIPASTGGLTIISTLFGPINNSAVPTAPSFSGGLTVDSNGFAVTFTNALLAATGVGVTQANMTVTGGSGYIGAPAVVFSSEGVVPGGTPAAGYALIDNGIVTGIVITSPGTYAPGTVPTVTLTGGGGTGAGVVLGSLTTPNVSGGITKLGTGTLTLSNAGNTYSGGNTVGTAGGADAGSLVATVSGALGNGGPLTIYGGIVNLTNATQSIGSLNLGGGAAGSTAVIALGTGTLALGGDVTYSAANNPNAAVVNGTGTITLNGNRTFTVGSSTAVLGGPDLVFNPSVANGTGTNGITKDGTGWLRLAGTANAYTGATIVNNGTLQLDSFAAGTTTAVTVAGGANLFLNKPGSTLNATTVTLANNARLTLSLGSVASGAFASLNAVGGISFGSAAQPVLIDLAAGSGLDYATAGRYLLITAPSGLAGTANTNFALNHRIGGYRLTLGSDDGSLYIDAEPGTIPTMYWKGDRNPDKNWSSVVAGQSNWTSDAGGTMPTDYFPGLMTDVVFSATGAANSGASVIATDGQVKSITVNDANATLILGGAGGTTLKFGAGLSGDMIRLNASSAGLTLGADAENQLSLVLTASSRFTNNSTGVLNLRNTIASAATTGTQVLTIDGSADTTIAGGLSNGTSGGVLGLTKTGTGLLTLGGTSAFTGGATISGGRVNVTGTVNLGASNWSATSTTKSVVRLNAGANLTANFLGIANAANAVSALYMAAGSALRQTGSATTSNASNFSIAGGTSSYGYFGLVDGSASVVRFVLGATGAGVVVMSGGTFTVSDYLLLGRGASTGSSFTLTGGTINHNAAANTLAVGFDASTGTHVVNISGGQFFNGNQPLTFGQNNPGGSAVGVVNLNGGTLSVQGVTKGATANTTALVNFNGGTLQATALNATFMTGLNAAYVYSGGGTIDTQAFDITIGQALLAPTNAGVAGVTLNANVGSGYIGAPLVTISGGGGIGATAIADMVDDGIGTYKIAGITITNPGVNYTSAPTITLSGGGASTVALPAGWTVSLAANSSGGITKIGTGALTLTGANTFTGGITVSAGRLNINNASALGTGTLTLAAGATIDNSSAGPLTATGNNAQAWNGNFTFVGTQDLNLGNGAVTLGANTQVTVSANTLTVGGIGGNYDLTKAGTGTLVLSGDGTYTGATTVAAGRLVITAVDALGTVSGGTTVASGATLELQNNIAVGAEPLSLSGTGSSNQGALFNAAGTNSFAGVVTLADGATMAAAASSMLNLTGNVALSQRTLTLQGSGTLHLSGNLTGAGVDSQLIIDGPTAILSGTNTYAGTTLISAGTLQVGFGGTTGTLGLGAVTNNATLSFARTDDYDGDVSSSIGGSGSVRVQGGLLTLTGENTYGGGISIAAGALVLGNTTALPSSGAVSFADGVGFGLRVGSGLFSTADVNALFNASTVTINGNTISLPTAAGSSLLVGIDTTPGNFTYATNAADFGSSIRGLFKVGPNTLTLSGNSTYTGPTNLRAGTLNVAGTLGNTAVTVAASAALIGTGTVGGVVTIQSGGRLAAGEAGVGTLTLGGLTLHSGALLDFEFGSGNDLIRVTSSNGLTLDGGSIRLYQTGTTDPFAGNGTYQLFQYAGSLGGIGIGALAIVNQNTDRNYAFDTAGGYVTLTISDKHGNYWAPAPSGGGGANSTWSADSTTWSSTAGTAGTGTQAPSGALIFTNQAGTVNVAGTVATANGLTFLADGYQFTGGTINLTGGTAAANVVTVDGGVTTGIASALNVTAGLTKAGLGTLNLSGNNSIGDLQVTAGTLNVTAGGLGADADLTVAAEATAHFAVAQTFDVVNIAGMLNFSGDHDSSLAVLNGSGSLHLADDVTLSIGAGTFTGNFTGTAAARFVKNTGGTLTLGGLNDNYLGTTTVESGTLSVATALGGTVIVNGGIFTGAGAAGSNVTINNGGQQEVTGEQSGTTDVNGGTTTVGNGGELAGDTTVSNDGTLNVSGTGTVTGSLVQDSGQVVVSGGGSVVGGATVNGGAFTVGSNGSVGGGITVGGGTFVAENNAVVSNNAAIAVIGGTFSLQNGASIVGDGGGAIQIGGSTTSAVFVSNGTTAAAVTVQSNGTLKGNGTVESAVILSGGTLSQGESVGKLVLNTEEIDDAEALNLHGGATLVFEFCDALGGVGTGWDAVDLNNGTLTFTGVNESNKINLNIVSWDPDNLGPGAAANFDFTVPKTYEWLFIAADSISGLTTEQINDHYGDYFAINDVGVFGGSNPPFGRPLGDDSQPATFGLEWRSGGAAGTNGLYVTFTAVPEPGSLLLGGLGSLAAAWYGKRKLRRQQAALSVATPAAEQVEI